ncbi:MAG: hypothetical protein ABEJ90_02375 [Halobacterium sp.]
MFTERDLSGDLAGVRDAYAPGALVLDSEQDFETVPHQHRDDLAALVDDVTIRDYEASWLPEDVPRFLERLTSSDFIVGSSGDGAVAWTKQTVPPVVLVKPRVEGSPESFVDFLVAEALVEAGLELPEQFLGFFRERYADFDDAVGRDPLTVYQLGNALYEAYCGLHTREEFETWADDYPVLYDAWEDAGERIAPRVADLPDEIARGETDVPDAAELACNAVKHGLDVPAPFGALDSVAYRRHGADYAVKWAEKVFSPVEPEE